MKEILEAPIAVTKFAAGLVSEGSGNALRGLGVALASRALPNYVHPRVKAHQSVLKQFEDRFAVIGNLMDREIDEEELDERISWAAHSIVDEGVVDQNTCLEIRPLLPEDAFYFPDVNQRRETVVKDLASVLTDQYGVQAIYNTHPITPTAHHESPIDRDNIWGEIADELDGLSRQIKPSQYGKVAMLAITDSDYEHWVFDQQIIAKHSPAATDELVVLRHVGDNSAQNLLLSRRVGILEHRQFTELAAAGLPD